MTKYNMTTAVLVCGYYMGTVHVNREKNIVNFMEILNPTRTNASTNADTVDERTPTRRQRYPRSSYTHCRPSLRSMKATCAIAVLVTLGCAHSFVAPAPRTAMRPNTARHAERINKTVELDKPKVRVYPHLQPTSCMYSPRMTGCFALRAAFSALKTPSANSSACCCSALACHLIHVSGSDLLLHHVSLT